MKQEVETTNPEEIVRESARKLASANGAPCLVFSSDIGMDELLPVLKELEGKSGSSVQLLLASHGGDIEAAFVLAQALRRRFEKLVVHVPLCARSAATLICLAADEIVMGELGALGPLDGQWTDSARSEHPGASQLALFAALGHLRKEGLELFEQALDLVVRETGMKPTDAATRAAELAGNLLGPVYSRIDPVVLGKTARGLDTGAAYAGRILQRWRPEVWAAGGLDLVERLVRGYPCHSFGLYLDEVEPLGIGARAPREAETPVLARLAQTLLACRENVRLIELVLPPAAEVIETLCAATT